MKKLLLILLLAGCGASVPRTPDCVTGNSCSPTTTVDQRATTTQTANTAGTGTSVCDTSIPGYAVCGKTIYQVPPVLQAPKDGKDGLNSLISSSPFIADTTICVSGSGIVMKTGLDTNNNGILEALEVAQTSVLCNGATGATGAAGVTGTSCTVTQQNNGATVSCTDGSVAAIKDGLDGAIGQTGATGLAGTPGANCSVQSVSGGQQITCGSSVATVLNGLNGVAGTNGTNGSSCSTIQTLTGATVSCTNGTTANLLNGAQGVQGLTGDTGLAGTSCTVASVTGGSKITCGSTSSVVTNGVNGLDGAVGATGAQGVAGTNAVSGAYNIVRVIQPCGANSSPWKEVLLLLASGGILADFSDNASGLNTRLSFIPNNSGYVDTDNSGCQFSVSGSGATRSVNWGAGSNSYSTWTAGSVSAAP